MSTTSELSRTPLYDWHTANGGRMVDFAGWAMPIQYTSIVEEHQAVRKRVGLFDISHMGRLIFQGTDTAKFLDTLTTRRVDNMKSGQIRYSLVCNEAGGVLDDVLVYCFETGDEPVFQMVVNGSNREKIVAWIDQHLPSNGVTLKDVTHETAMIAVQGPRAIELVEPLIACDVADIKYFNGLQTTFNDKSCHVSRSGYTGEDGCEICCNKEDAPEIWQTLVDALTPFDGQAAGLACRDTLRLEAAMPLYGHELTEAINPVQAGLGFAVRLKDRTFIGSEAIAGFQNDPNQMVRVGLELEGRRVPREGYAVLLNGEKVGEVCSGTFSPTFERPIAMAYVPPAASATGTQLEVDLRGKALPAKVVPLPFYKRS